MNKELNDIIKKLKYQGKMAFQDAASDKQIVEFETQNLIALPYEYKEWLRYSDGGECFLPVGVQLYGVAHKPLIDPTDNNRPNRTYTVIGALPNGDPVLIQNASDMVSIYNSEAGRIEDDEVYESFFAFLKDMYNFLGLGD